MDCWLHAPVSRPERASGHRLHGGSRLDISSRCSLRRVAWQPSLSRLHGALPGIMGHERRVLAGLEPHSDGMCVDGNSSILGRSRSASKQDFYFHFLNSHVDSCTTDHFSSPPQPSRSSCEPSSVPNSATSQTPSQRPPTPTRPASSPSSSSSSSSSPCR